MPDVDRRPLSLFLSCSHSLSETISTKLWGNSGNGVPDTSTVIGADAIKGLFTIWGTASSQNVSTAVNDKAPEEVKPEPGRRFKRLKSLGNFVRSVQAMGTPADFANHLRELAGATDIARRIHELGSSTDVAHRYRDASGSDTVHRFHHLGGASAMALRMSRIGRPTGDSHRAGKFRAATRYIRHLGSVKKNVRRVNDLEDLMASARRLRHLDRVLGNLTKKMSHSSFTLKSEFSDFRVDWLSRQQSREAAESTLVDEPLALGSVSVGDTLDLVEEDEGENLKVGLQTALLVFVLNRRIEDYNSYCGGAKATSNRTRQVLSERDAAHFCYYQTKSSASTPRFLSLKLVLSDPRSTLR